MSSECVIGCPSNIDIMLVSPVLACTICIAIGILRPIAMAHHALEHGTHKDVERWLAFFMCASLTLVPMWCATWFPLRYEVSILSLLVFGAADARGAQALYLRYIRGLMLSLFHPFLNKSFEDVDALLVALESTVSSCLFTKRLSEGCANGSDSQQESSSARLDEQPEEQEEEDDCEEEGESVPNSK